MKSKWLLSILAALPVALIPFTAVAQATPDSSSTPTSASDHPSKYSLFVGGSYTSLNQVNQSRYGLVGPEISITRNWGRYFGLTADGGWYPHSVASGNPGKPNVEMVFFGPEIHGHILDNWSIFARALLGGEHTGGENMTPKVSFAGGGGFGVDWDLSPRISIRAYGDDIASSFSLRNNTPQLGYSPHMRRNSRAGIGVVYHF